MMLIFSHLTKTSVNSMHANGFGICLMTENGSRKKQPLNKGVTWDLCPILLKGCSRPVVKVSDRGWLVTNSSPVPLKTHHVGQRCTLNLSRAETSSRWCGVVVRRGGASSGVVHVT
ncbi:uncharacterized protein TNCV_986811 [Trichonephila clavipes]|nr:uncharacterized protein TNCV_986811 [Trichonephila clavipes]